MNSPTASRSRWYSWNSATFSPSTIREWPVPTGSMNTRSLSVSSVCSLSTSAYGGGGALPISSVATRWGPRIPRCSHTLLEPGPPLKLKVTGRCSGFLTPLSV